MAAPNNQEQLLLELINETRMDPMGAASRYIFSYSPLVSSDPWVQAGLTGVSGSALQRAFEALVPTTPVAWNEQLADAATGHSQLMISFDQQSHQLPGEGGVLTRVNNAGYNASYLGECVYAYSQSMLFAMAGFMVDWGPGADGMQTPAGHRLNTMDSRFCEIGLGVISDTNAATTVGPFVVTEDFGIRQSSPQVFLLGVSYADLDSDHFYSVGEGRVGMNISTTGGGHQTSASGGYTVELAAGVQNISFSGGGLASPLFITTDFASGTNAKIDVRDASTILSSVSLSVISGVSEVVALGTSSLKLVGTSGHQLLRGNNGGDTLSGLSGDDTLAGGTGNDILDGGDGFDWADYQNAVGSVTVNLSLPSMQDTGAAGADQLIAIEAIRGSSYNDTLTGNSGNNILCGFAGNDHIDGGSGTDTAIFSAFRANSTLTKTVSGWTISSSSGGSDTLTNIERLQFSDKTIALDIEGNAGQAYRLYQAAFNRTPDVSGLTFQTHTLDDGWGLSAIAKNFIDSPEFSTTYGSLNNTLFVTQLYQNVLHRVPDAGGLQYHVDHLNQGWARENILVGFSESPENQVAVIGIIQNGIELIG